MKSRHIVVAIAMLGSLWQTSAAQPKKKIEAGAPPPEGILVATSTQSKPVLSDLIALKPDMPEAHCNLGSALSLKGRFAEALISLRRGHELGSKNPRWPFPSAQWVKECERLVELDAKLSDRRSELARRQAELSSRERKLAWYAWFDPVVRKWTPSTPFATLTMLMGVMIVGVALKGFFDFLQEYLATGVVQLAVFDLRNEYFRKALNLDLTHFSEHGTHDLGHHLRLRTRMLCTNLGEAMLQPVRIRHVRAPFRSCRAGFQR